MPTRLLRVIFSLIAGTALAAGQYDHGCETDFGLAYISLRPLSHPEIPFYAAPVQGDSAAAVLHTRIREVGKNSFSVGFELTVLSTNSVVEMSERLIEVYRVDEYGLPVLAFSADSDWAEVSLDCKQLQDPPTAWVKVGGPIRVKFWSDFFGPDWALVFNCDTVRAFYSRPDEGYRILPKLAGDPDNPDYCLRVLKVFGEWMEVYLESPSTFMEDLQTRQARYKSAKPPPKLWIKYLDETGRPRVWYLWE